MRFALMSLVAVSIGRVHQVFPVLSALRPGLLLLAIAVGYALLAPETVAWRLVVRSWVGQWILVFGGWSILSAFGGISVGNSAMYLLEDFSKVILASVITLAAIRGLTDVRRFLLAYVLSMLVWIYLALFVLDSSTAGSRTARVTSSFMFDSNDLGLILLMGLPFALTLIQASAGSRAMRLLGTAAALGAVATLALTGSRGALVGLGALGVAGLTLADHVSLAKKVLAVAACLGLLAVAAPPGYWEQMGTLLTLEEDYNMTSVDGRRALAERGVGYMLTHPVFGVGPDNFPRAEFYLSDKDQELPLGRGVRMTAAHNTVVQVGAELGVPGLLLWIFATVRMFIGAGRLRRSVPISWKQGTETQRLCFFGSRYFQIAVVGFTVPSFFVSFAYLTPFYLLLLLFGAFEANCRLETKASAVMRKQGIHPAQRARLSGET